MNIGYPHCEINNAFSYFRSGESVKSAPKSKLSKVKRVLLPFFSPACFVNENREDVGSISFDSECFPTVATWIIIFEV